MTFILYRNITTIIQVDAVARYHRSSYLHIIIIVVHSFFSHCSYVTSKNNGALSPPKIEKGGNHDSIGSSSGRKK